MFRKILILTFLFPGGICLNAGPAMGMIPKDVFICDWNYERLL
jgi:hypothetical protein